MARNDDENALKVLRKYLDFLQIAGTISDTRNKRVADLKVVHGKDTDEFFAAYEQLELDDAKATEAAESDARYELKLLFAWQDGREILEWKLANPKYT